MQPLTEQTNQAKVPAPLPEPPFLLRDLTLPEEIQKIVKKRCRRYHCWFARSRRRIEEEIKLQHFFGGQNVVYRSTPEGLLIIAFGIFGTEPFQTKWDSMSRQELRGTILDAPCPLNDDNGFTYIG